MRRTIGGFLLVVVISLVAPLLVAAETNHALLLPQHNPQQGGTMLSRQQIAAALKNPEGVFRPGAVKALIASWKARGLPVSDPENAAAFLRTATIQEVPCVSIKRPDGKIQTASINNLGVLGWFHRHCYDGEVAYEWEGKAFFLPGCGNPVYDERPVQTQRLPPTAVALPPMEERPSPPPRQEQECVELSEFYRRGNIVTFPTVEDRGAWFECNPWAECVIDCIEWVSGHRENVMTITHSRNSRARWSQEESARIREITGQGTRGAFTALKGATKRPLHRKGDTVWCVQGTHSYWVLKPDGRVIKGLDHH